jgi:hypothetical protein
MMAVWLQYTDDHIDIFCNILIFHKGPNFLLGCPCPCAYPFGHPFEHLLDILLDIHLDISLDI